MPTPGPDTGPGAVLLISVEEYYQARAFRDLVLPGEWASLPDRAAICVDRLLRLLDRHGARATFFLHRWPAEREPALAARISDAGHEVAALGECGARRYPPSRHEMTLELRRVGKLLEEQSSGPVVGHRCLASSLENGNEWFFDTLLDAGYVYDASAAAATPWRRTRSGSQPRPHLVRRPGGKLLELPTSRLKVAGLPLLPACGTTLRNLPPRVVARGLRQGLDEGRAPVFHLHAWEVDPNQPSLPISTLDRIRHYRGLEDAADRLGMLLSEIPFTSVAEQFRLDGGVRRGRPNLEATDGGRQEAAGSGESPPMKDRPRRPGRESGARRDRVADGGEG